MNQTVSSNQKWKISTIISAVLLIVMAVLSAYALVQNNSLNNDKTNLQNNYNTLKTTDDANVQKIDSLNSNIATLNSQISSLNAEVLQLQQKITDLNGQITTLTSQLSTLQAQVNADQTTIAQLQAKIASLNAQVATDQQTIATLNAQIVALQAAFVTGTYSWTTSCFFTCTATVTNVAYGNTGTITANNAVMTARFYSRGTLLCSLHISLGGYGAGDASGVVPGQTVSLLFGLSNSCGTGFTSATLATVSFSWT